MSKPIPTDRSESVFEDYKTEYDANQAVVEANRCLYCSDAPCIKACPTHIDIPEFIRKIATGNVKGSARTIFDSNILGMSCARVCPVEVLCVGDCVYNEHGRAADPDRQAAALRHRSRVREGLAVLRGRRADTGKSVGLVGAGPASPRRRPRAAPRRPRLHHLREASPSSAGSTPPASRPTRCGRTAPSRRSSGCSPSAASRSETGVEVGKRHFASTSSRRSTTPCSSASASDRTPGSASPAKISPGVQGAVAFIERMKLGKLPLAAVKQRAGDRRRQHRHRRRARALGRSAFPT